MEREIVVCIPGTWADRRKLVESVVVSTNGEFMFAGMILAHPSGNEHVELVFSEPYEQMASAFEFGGQGKISTETLEKVAEHQSFVTLYFTGDIVSQKDRILKFTEVLSKCGGIAVRLENSGIAVEWQNWFELLGSDNLFHTYSASVVLIGDEQYYYSCGMHSFGLPDTQISNRFDPAHGADLINRFNYWQIVEKPVLEAGHSFSLTEDSPHFRLGLTKDLRHSEDELFYNSHGIWELRHEGGH